MIETNYQRELAEETISLSLVDSANFDLVGFVLKNMRRKLPDAQILYLRLDQITEKYPDG